VARQQLEKYNAELPVLADVSLYTLISQQLSERGIERSENACKIEWNRNGRETTGYDERVGEKTNLSLVTSAQGKSNC
jgi:hypothetical protein